MAKDSQRTPMMAQYFSVKEEYPDAIVLFRMGDFYETFFDDAVTASRVLGIALTSRAREGDKRIPLAGVPHHAVDTYVARLIRAGHKVAICEQVEDPREAKGLVRRKVVEVITPGTVTSSLLLEDKENNYLVAVMCEGDAWGLARADLSTGEFAVAELSTRDIYEELAKLRPSEILYQRDCLEDEKETRIRQILPGVALTGLDPWLFLPDSASSILRDHFEVSSLESFGIEGIPLATGAAGAVITYLRQTQKRLLPHISRLSTYRKSLFMEIDEDSLANLEILAPLNPQDADASLIEVLDRTLTAMGGRTLRAWVRNPLVDREEITKRLEAVGDLLADEIMRKDLRSILRQVSDLERLIARVCTEKAGPRDLVAVRDSLTLVPAIRKIISGSSSRLLAGCSEEIPDPVRVVEMIRACVKDDAPALFKHGAVVESGFDATLDDLRKASQNAKQWILDLQAEERERTGIPNLKIGYNKVFGYYIEVSRSNLKNVPDDYIRKQTLVGGERYVTQGLKDKEAEILQADDRASALEEEIFRNLRASVAEQTSAIQEAARQIAALDVLASFAEVAREND